MAEATISLQEAAELMGRLKAAAEGNGRFPEVVMPNGRRLADCTFGYIGQLGEAMQVMGLQMLVCSAAPLKRSSATLDTRS
jgi:hypothetical protein